jgi:hypothetical protein
MSENPDKTGPTRVLLADDHTMFRQGLAGVLASYGGMEIIAEVPNDADALHGEPGAGLGGSLATPNFRE